MDTEIDEYVGLVEFNSRFDKRVEVDSINQVLQYLTLIGSKSTPAFLLTPKGEDDFRIFHLTESEEWKKIGKSDFPTLGILSTKKQIEEKQLKKELEKKIYYEEYLKKKKDD